MTFRSTLRWISLSRLMKLRSMKSINDRAESASRWICGQNTARQFSGRGAEPQRVDWALRYLEECVQAVWRTHRRSTSHPSPIMRSVYRDWRPPAMSP